MVEATDLPGLRCRPDPAGGGHENVHVGLCRRGAVRAGPPVVPERPWSVVDLVRGDAAGARWEMEVDVRGDHRVVDFGGPFVRGKRDDRHVGLAWGEVAADGTFHLFRGAKLRLDAVDPAVLERARQPGWRLVGRLGLTDRHGQPRCASVRPPDIEWAAEE